MANMPSLPLETIQSIIEFASVDGLLALRLASKAFCALASPRAFHTISCTNTVKSTAGLLSLLDRPGIRTHVREISYRTLDSIPVYEQSATPEPTDGEDDEIRQNLIAAIKLFPAVPLLSSVQFTFSPLHFEVEPDTPTPRLEVQIAVLTALATLSSHSIYSLTLENIYPIPDPAYTSPSFLAFVAQLRHLRLATASDDVPDDYVTDGPIVPFYEDCLPSILRAPQNSLTSLEFLSDIDVGVAPGLDLGQLHYPHLTNLALRHVLFDAGTGVEAFILAHSTTLTSLTLRSCRIALDEVETPPDRPWAQVYTAFRQGLVHLRRLDIQEDEEDLHWKEGGLGLRKLRYGRCDPGYGWSPYAAHGAAAAVWTAGDDAALNEFRDTVRQRAA
ncbi:hypothetical protein BV25DRAFT_1993242 [Artomyces pyxidatus]|uniref:Uncharacterized protein n=1 Tax=Artomyces pyxidatus TaxID=48021 RepID=A0ACB8SU58_9AGAM|nr:hypothetical protein BV25DRAFT_1993242 [Artomyces pyxidatus]